MKNYYGLHGKFKAKPGQGQELAKILLRASQRMSKLKSCHLYMVCMDKDNEDLILVHEVWADKDAHDNSLSDKDIRDLIAQALPLLAESPEQGRETIVLNQPER